MSGRNDTDVEMRGQRQSDVEQAQLKHTTKVDEDVNGVLFSRPSVDLGNSGEIELILPQEMGEVGEEIGEAESSQRRRQRHDELKQRKKKLAKLSRRGLTNRKKRRRAPGHAIKGFILDYGISPLKDNLVDFVGKTLNRRQKKWYQSPEVRHFGDEEQEEFETDWAELFFDLIYVSMVFKLGDVLGEELSNPVFDSQLAILFFLGQFLPVYEAWHRRANYLARFVANSLVHKLIDITENVLVAFMALFIGTRSQILAGALLSSGISDEGPVILKNETMTLKGLEFPRAAVQTDEVEVGLNLLFAFCVAKLCFNLIYVVKYMEVRKYAYARTTRQREGLMNVTGYALKKHAVNFVLTFIASYLCYVGRVHHALVVLISCFFFTGFVMSYIYVFFNHSQPGVPYNVFFLMKRFGEFTMLMLGEGVLQIIIFPIPVEDVSGHLVTFYISFMILNTFEFIKFYLVPNDPERHVLSKSVWREPFVFLLYPVFYATLICIGVSLKFALKHRELLDDVTNVRLEWLLCASLCVAFFVLLLINVLHLGLFDLVFKTDFNYAVKSKRSIFHLRSECMKMNNLRTSKICYTLFFLLCTCLFLPLPLLYWGGTTLLGLCWLVILVLFGLSVVEKSYFTDYNFETSGNEPTAKAQAQLEFMNRPAFETELAKMNYLWKNAFETNKSADEGPTTDVQEKFFKRLDCKKEQLNHMLNYLRAHSHNLQGKFSAIHTEKLSRDGVEKLLMEVKELRELTTLIEENTCYLVPQYKEDILSSFYPMMRDSENMTTDGSVTNIASIESRDSSDSITKMKSDSFEEGSSVGNPAEIPGLQRQRSRLRCESFELPQVVEERRPNSASRLVRISIHDEITMESQTTLKKSTDDKMYVKYSI